MNSKLAFVLGLATGATVGAVVSWRVSKARYQKILEEETASMREVLAKKAAEAVAEEQQNEPEETEVELPDDVADAMRRYDRVSEELQNGGKIVMGKHPYVISPEEYGEVEDYKQESLTYYDGDGVLAYYATDEMVEDVAGMVGTDSLSHFGEYEDDSVFVRNDALKTDFEILLDPQKYSEVKRRVLSSTTEE